MIEQQANVVAIEGDMAVVLVERQTACGNCSAKSGCGSSVIAGLFPQRQQTLRLCNTQQVAVGDRVVIGLPETGLQRASLLMYGVPLLALIAGAALGQQFGGTDFTAAIAALLGFASGLLVVRRVSRGSRRLQPVMLRRVSRSGVAVAALQSLQH